MKPPAPREQAGDSPQGVTLLRRRKAPTKRRKKAPPPVSSKPSPATHTLTNEFGERGLFAQEDIAEGSVVVAFGGRVVDQGELDSLPAGRRRFALQIEEGLFLYSDYDGPGDWVNHSCAPNVGVRGQVVLVAMRAIEAGEEICFDYAMTDCSDYDAFVCACGAPGCRGKVGGDDWRLPELQSRYAGYFGAHVARLIGQSRS